MARYAFGGGVNQTMMERTYAKLTNNSVVPGFGKSLRDVGYRFANLDECVFFVVFWFPPPPSSPFLLFSRALAGLSVTAHPVNMASCCPDSRSVDCPRPVPCPCFLLLF